MRLAIRGYVGRKVMFCDRIDMPEEDLVNLVPELATKHAQALADHALHMIEIEFLDELDPNERYFRLGTDPSGMVVPLAIDLSKKPPRNRGF